MTNIQADSFHRLAKTLVDSGEVASLQEALDTFAAYGVRLVLAPNVAGDVGAQIIALTVINTAARSFLGNVAVDSPDFELTAPGFEGTRLSDFLSWARVTPQLPPSSAQWPVIFVGEGAQDATSIRPWANGWGFGVGARQPNGQVFAPACVAAAGLAVGEAFSQLRKDNVYAGRRELNLSLWLGEHAEAPVPTAIGASGLWLVGLGHLGQAYAWTLGFTQSPAGKAAHVLQDVDVITESTLSSSVISRPEQVGSKKTRVVAAWLEARGFRTAIVERRFDEHQRVGAGEPMMALFGVDNAAARRSSENCGFRLVVDAGLGSGYRDFRAMRLRTFPGPSKAAQLWAAPQAAASEAHELAPAYCDMLAKGADPCGVTTLATRAVGAPFVGCVAAGYALAEIARRELGGGGASFIDLNLKDPQRHELEILEGGSYGQ